MGTLFSSAGFVKLNIGIYYDDSYFFMTESGL